MDRNDSQDHARVSVSHITHFTSNTKKIFLIRNLPSMKPALNWGVQFRTLQADAPGDKSKMLRKDLEIVYPGVGKEILQFI